MRLMFSLLIAALPGAWAQMAPHNLCCNALSDPLGIDTPRPMLSWTLETTTPGARGQTQSAYQIAVASTQAGLLQGAADVWDSGRTVSAETLQVAYGGRELGSHELCFWHVRVWDQDDRPSAWSDPAVWSMGVLQPEQWGGEWIGFDAAAPGASAAAGFGEAEWIWCGEDESPGAYPEGKRAFRRVQEIPGTAIAAAVCLVTADDQFELVINGQTVGSSDGREDAWRRPRNFDVAGVIVPGSNTLAVLAQNTGPGAAGLLLRVRITTTDGEVVDVISSSAWHSCQGVPEDWQASAQPSGSWKPVKTLGRVGVAPWGVPGSGGAKQLPPAPFLRRTFRVEDGLRRATLVMAVLGVADPSINGAAATEDVLAPGWADFRRRCWYRTYDVSDKVVAGDNVLGLVLGDGWYAGYVGYGGVRNRYGGEPRARCLLRLEYADGRVETIPSDASWRASYGPVLEGDLQMGETYDARLEQSGWDRPGFADASWEAVQTGGPDNLVLQAHPGVPVRRVMELPVLGMTDPAPGVTIMDLGQNMVGWARLKVAGAEAGQRITLRFGEILNGDGSLHTANLRGARATDAYICKGGVGEEVWEPRFTFHGFRYVEVTGYPGRPEPGAITGIVVSSATPVVGSFDCGVPAVNRLYSNIVWGQRGNFLEIPTDCPQRDERLGWTGDIVVFLQSAAYNMDVNAFMSKWLIDLADSQQSDGAYAHVAPAIDDGRGSPGWSDAGILCPYDAYMLYGRLDLVRQYYPGMLRYMAYLEKRARRHLQPAMGFGDWVSAGPETPKDVIATAFYARCAFCMSEMATALGKTEDQEHFSRLFRQVRQAFAAAYVDPNGIIKGDTQTDYALALAFGLLPRSSRSVAATRLRDDVSKRGDHLTTGFLGTPALLPMLSEGGYVSKAYDLLLQDSYPSWLYTVNQGATTIWERWNSYTHDHGIYEPSMNSFNHYAFGSVGEWLFGTVGGIQPLAPGYARVRIRPRPDTRLGHAAVTFDSPRGPIRSSWRLDGDTLGLDVGLPANVSAEIWIPATSVAAVTEGGEPADQAAGVGAAAMQEGCAVFRVGSGLYHFAAAASGNTP